MRWFEASPRRAAPKGQLPSSPAQHRIKEFLLHETPFRALGAPCYLTCLLAGGFLGLVSFDGLAHVVAGGRVAVLRAGRASGAGFAGFRRAGQIGQCLADVAEPSPDPGGGQAAGRAGPLPGQPQVFGESAGQPELGAAGQAMMIQVHRSAAAGSRSFGRVQPRTCFRNLNVCS